MHPLTVQITTRDTAAGREVQHHYAVESSHPRWDLLRIFLRAFFEVKFR